MTDPPLITDELVRQVTAAVLGKLGPKPWPRVTNVRIPGIVQDVLETAAPLMGAAYRAALQRHMQWFVKDDVKICGGCLREWPCSDAALLREQP